MAPSPSPEPSFESPAPTFDESGFPALLDIAEDALAAALAGQPPALPPLASLPTALHVRMGAFVTLTVAGRLNGCIGNIEGVEPIGRAIARLALSAAFDDPRLPALQPGDFAHLSIAVSLLSPLSPIDANSRAELRATLRPGHDGLVITAGSRGSRQALFLPSVWEQLRDPDEFLHHLWRKAGLTPDAWPAGMRTFRFSAVHRERAVGAGRSTAA